MRLFSDMFRFVTARMYAELFDIPYLFLKLRQNFYRESGAKPSIWSSAVNHSSHKNKNMEIDNNKGFANPLLLPAWKGEAIIHLFYIIIISM